MLAFNILFLIFQNYYEIENQGFFPGTYSFEEGIIYKEGKNSFISEYDDCEKSNARIINEKEGHNKVLKLSFNGSISSQLSIFNKFNNRQHIGSIEFWFFLSEHNNILLELQNKDGLIGPYLKIENNRLYSLNLYDSYQLIENKIVKLSPNEWHKIKIEFQCQTHSYYLFIDDIQLPEEIEYAWKPYEIEKFGIRLKYCGFEQYLYLDGINYSWQSGIIYDISLYLILLEFLQILLIANLIVKNQNTKCNIKNNQKKIIDKDNNRNKEISNFKFLIITIFILLLTTQLLFIIYTLNSMIIFVLRSNFILWRQIRNFFLLLFSFLFQFFLISKDK